jgi:hypothetical protein
MDRGKWGLGLGRNRMDKAEFLVLSKSDGIERK